MAETTKAYVSDDWMRGAITVQVVEGDQRSQYGRRVGVVERPTGLEDHAPILRMIPVLDLVGDDGQPRPSAPHPGLSIPVDAAEAILVALLAWSSSTPGDNPVERAKAAEAERDEALAQVADLEHRLELAEAQADLRVAEASGSSWEVLAVAKDEQMAVMRDHLHDLSQYAQRDAARLERLDHPGVTVRREDLERSPADEVAVARARIEEGLLHPGRVHMTAEGVRIDHEGHCGHTATVKGQEMVCTRPADHSPTGHHDGAAWWDDDGREIPPL